jgi:inner membrane protein
MPMSVDNATHALVGLLLAEAAILLVPAARAPDARFFRGAARAASVFANNVNDLDFVYARRLGGKLGYILHHRGYTHTLLAGLILGVAIYFSMVLLAKLRRQTLTAAERATVLALCCIGPCVHIGFDFLNNYGVHPFWPFDKHWFYGDTLFIIEPWLWVLVIPPLYFRAETRFGRGALGVLFVVGLGLAWALRLVPFALALLLTLGGAASALWSSRAGARARVLFAWAAALSVVVVFAVSSRVAQARVSSALATQASDPMLGVERTVDIVITPSPGNPLCFSVVSVHVSGSRYIARAASLSLAAPLISPEACRVQRTGLTLGLRAATRRSVLGVRWEGEFVGSLAELGELERKHCEVSALLRFARVPFWRKEGKNQLLVGDLRFDRDPDLDFDEFVIGNPSAACPPVVPDWSPPCAALGPR